VIEKHKTKGHVRLGMGNIAPNAFSRARSFNPLPARCEIGHIGPLDAVGFSMEADAAQTDVQRREGSESSESAAARSNVVAALGRVEEGQRDAMDDLRVALCTYVGVLRREGLSRDATLAGIRTLIAAPATPGGAISLTPVVRQALAELTLQWCEEEYNRLAEEKREVS
jgi:hypothetical protein